MEKVRVGLIGVEPNRSWAARAHLPALESLNDRFQIAGIANSSEASSRHAAEALGIEKSFSSAGELVSSPDVDVAAVTVKVPNHLELVSKAVNAGKHVYCEWPLGRNLEEAEELQRLVQERGVHAAIGTQALRAPAVRYLKQRIADGYVGRVLSICLIGSGGLGGAEVDAANAYTVEASAGASLLTIPFGHTMAALMDIFGELTSVQANLVTRQTSVKVIGTDKVLTATAPDQVVVQGVFQQEIPFSAHYRGGTNPGTGLLLEIVGTEGTLQITGPLGHMQLVPLTLSGAQGARTSLAPLTIPESFRANPNVKGPPANVAALYDDITEGARKAPTFADAVVVHRLIDAIEKASQAGR